MYNRDTTIGCINDLIGWRDHWDATEIPPLPVELTESKSGEFYQDIDPKLGLDIIEPSLPPNRELSEYLQTEEEGSIIGLINDIMTAKKIKGSSQDIISSDIIYNSQGWVTDTILNESYFVGVKFQVRHRIGIKAIINRIALQLTEAQTNLTLYLYHSHLKNSVAEIDYTTTIGGQVNWINTEIDLFADTEELSGGTYYLGYYQDHLTGKAIQYKKLNWKTGYCGTCGNAAEDTKYNTISQDVDMCAFYVPTASLPPVGEMFDPADVREVLETNWGFNFNMSVVCDFTQFWCINKNVLITPLKLKMKEKIYRMIHSSTQRNHIDENSKAAIYFEINGNPDTNQLSLQDQYEKSIKALNLDLSGISKKCLDCHPQSRVSYKPF